LGLKPSRGMAHSESAKRGPNSGGFKPHGVHP
jgi:hypothetical protein